MKTGVVIVFQAPSIHKHIFRYFGILCDINTCYKQHSSCSRTYIHPYQPHKLVRQKGREIAVDIQVHYTTGSSGCPCRDEDKELPNDVTQTFQFFFHLYCAHIQLHQPGVALCHHSHKHFSPVQSYTTINIHSQSCLSDVL